MRALVAAFAALAACGCVPSLGPFVLESVAGRVVDTDTGLPIAGAEVIEWWRGGGVPGAARPEYHARWTSSGADGVFAFAGGLAPSPRMWLLETYGPTFSFYHPRYGLVHAGPGVSERSPGEPRPERSDPGGHEPIVDVVLRGSLRQASQRLQDLAVWCRGEHEGAGARHLASIACAPPTQRGE